MPGRHQSRQPLRLEAVLRLRRQFCRPPSAGDGGPSRGHQRRRGAEKDRRKQRLDDRRVRLTQLATEKERWRDRGTERRREGETCRQEDKETIPSPSPSVPLSLRPSVPLSLRLSVPLSPWLRYSTPQTGSRSPTSFFQPH